MIGVHKFFKFVVLKTGVELLQHNSLKIVNKIIERSLIFHLKINLAFILQVGYNMKN